MLAAPKGPQQNCYKCKVTPATVFSRVASCRGCLHNKLVSAIVKVWYEHLGDAPKIRCVVVADSAQRRQLIITALNSLGGSRRPEIAGIITQRPDIDSSLGPAIDVSDSLDRLRKALPATASRLTQEVLEWRLYASVSQALDADIIIAPFCQEEVAAKLMGKMIRGDFSILRSSLIDYAWSNVTSKDATPMPVLMVLGRTSLEELTAVEDGTEDSLKKTSCDMSSILESFFKENMRAFPSVASNVCRTTDKLPLQDKEVTWPRLQQPEDIESLRNKLCSFCCQALTTDASEATTWLPVAKSPTYVNAKLCFDCEAYKEHVPIIDNLI